MRSALPLALLLLVTASQALCQSFPALETHSVPRAAVLATTTSSDNPLPSKITLRAVGTAIVSLVPDQVVVSFSVMSNASSAVAVASALAAKSNRLVEELKRVLPPEPTARVETAYYNIYPVYDYPYGALIGRLLGYRGDVATQVTLNNVTLAGPTIDTAVTAGADSVRSLTWGLQDRTKARRDAIGQASQDGLAAVQGIAAAIGHTGNLRVLSVQESGSTTNTPSPAYYDNAPGSSSAPVASTAVIPGFLSVNAQVIVTAEVD